MRYLTSPHRAALIYARTGTPVDYYTGIFLCLPSDAVVRFDEDISMDAMAVICYHPSFPAVEPSRPIPQLEVMEQAVAIPNWPGAMACRVVGLRHPNGTVYKPRKN
jgi:hypothetical protein